MSLLDIGTGPTGVLAIYAKQKLLCGTVCGTDHLQELLPLAANSAKGCGAKVAFKRSSLFSNVQGMYDLITFNAPYVPIEDGRRLGVFHNEFEERRWSGGDTGLQTIQGFLNGAPNHLSPRGQILLGVNHFYVSDSALRSAFDSAGLYEVESRPNRLTLSCTYVLRPRCK
jgi:release factor glutamine methyltransferase